MRKNIKIRRYLQYIIQKSSLMRALWVALLVGIILNIINNPSLLHFSFEDIHLFRAFLTFIVPFFVSLYSSMLANSKQLAELRIENQITDETH